MSKALKRRRNPCSLQGCSIAARLSPIRYYHTVSQPSQSESILDFVFSPKEYCRTRAVNFGSAATDMYKFSQSANNLTLAALDSWFGIVFSEGHSSYTRLLSFVITEGTSVFVFLIESGFVSKNSNIQGYQCLIYRLL